MTFEEKKTEYEAFRKRLIPIVLVALPSDPAKVVQERAELEPLYFEALEFQADLESLYYASKVTHTKELLEKGFPKSACLEYAKALSGEERKYYQRAYGAVEAIKSRNIKLSQQIKQREG